MTSDAGSTQHAAFEVLFRDFIDRAAPMLDVYEQAIYLYVLRHTLLESAPEAVVAFKSARKRMAMGVGTANTRMAEGTLSQKLQSLVAKGFLEVVRVEHKGTRVRLRTPREVLGPAIPDDEEAVPDILDYFMDKDGRQIILKRDANRCFYCLMALTHETFVIDHLVSRPDGDNSYGNCVAACRDCNNRKKAKPAEEYLRQLLRTHRLSDSEFDERLQAIDSLRGHRTHFD